MDFLTFNWLKNSKGGFLGDVWKSWNSKFSVHKWTGMETQPGSLVYTLSVAALSYHGRVGQVQQGLYPSPARPKTFTHWPLSENLANLWIRRKCPPMDREIKSIITVIYGANRIGVSITRQSSDVQGHWHCGATHWWSGILAAELFLKIIFIYLFNVDPDWPI